jgi:hypothetical protein
MADGGIVIQINPSSGDALASAERLLGLSDAPLLFIQPLLGDDGAPACQQGAAERSR